MRMAFSNLLGSNTFNMGVVVPAEAVAFGARPFFGGLSMVHLVGAMAAILMTGLAVWRACAGGAEEAPASHWSTYARAVVIIGLFGASAYLTFVVPAAW